MEERDGQRRARYKEGARKNSGGVSDLSLYFLLAAAAAAAMRTAPSKNSHLGTTPVSQKCSVVTPSGHLLWSSVCWAMDCSQKHE